MRFFQLSLPFFFAITVSNAIAQPAPPGGPPVVITEIMYNPPGVGVNSLEFIEIKNPHPSNQRNIGGYTFTAGIEYTFPLNTILDPHEYILIAIDSVVFENTFGIPAFQWTSGDLSNNGEALILKNNLNGTADSVVFNNIAPWPTEPDGNGASLVFCNDTLENSNSDNWTACLTNTGIMLNGSAVLCNPGSGCTVTDGVDEQEQNVINIYPNPAKGWVRFSSKNSFANSETLIQIYNAQGKLVQEKSLRLQNQSVLNLNPTLKPGQYTISLIGEKTNQRQPLLILE
jgi:hypothetical protein